MGYFKQKIMSFSCKHLPSPTTTQPSPPFLKNQITEEVGRGGPIACTVLHGKRFACSEAPGYACGTWQSLGTVGQQIPNVA